MDPMGILKVTVTSRFHQVCLRRPHRTHRTCCTAPIKASTRPLAFSKERLRCRGSKSAIAETWEMPGDIMGLKWLNHEKWGFHDSLNQKKREFQPQTLQLIQSGNELNRQTRRIWQVNRESSNMGIFKTREFIQKDCWKRIRVYTWRS